MGSFLGGPPLPTDQGALPAPDVPAVNAYSPSSNVTDTLNSLNANSSGLRNLALNVNPTPLIFPEILTFVVKILGELWVVILKSLVALQVDYNNALTELHKAELPVGVPAARDMAAEELSILLSALGSTATANYLIPGSDITAEGEDLWQSLIEPFTLFNNTADPTQFGAGFQNAQFLLKRAMTLALAEYTLDSMKNLVGFGWMSNLEPLLGFIDRSINPSNVVRQAMEQAYSFLLKAPMQRDLNHLYPIKDLGITALAKLYIRDGIDETTYLNKALDAGLNNQQAQQLIIETAKLLDTGDIATLLNHKYITEEDALQQLKWEGYPDWQANAILYLETHKRYFTIQERVGTAAVDAWKKGKIDQAQLEGLLNNLGFNPDEIQLLEIEGQFVKTSTEQKTLTASEVKRLYDANLVDIDYVINFYTKEGYSAEDTRLLILLEFTKAAERAQREALLLAKIRVQEEAQLTAATKEAQKNETDLANARKALAAELNSFQHNLGQLQALPGILQLLGISL